MITKISSISQLGVTLYDRWDVADLDESPRIALDTETTSLEPDEGEIRLFQVYLPKLKQVAVLDLWGMDEKQADWFDYLLEIIESDRVIKILQNSMFDGVYVYIKYKKLFRNILDTLVMSQLDKAGQYDCYKAHRIFSPNNLEHLSASLLGFEVDKTLGASNWGEYELTQAQIEYAALDPVLTYKIASKLSDRFKSHNKAALRAELNCLPAYIFMQAEGLPVNLEALEKLCQTYGDKALELALELAGVENPEQYLKSTDWRLKLGDRFKKVKDYEINLEQALLPYNPTQRKKVEQDQANPRYGKKGQLLKQNQDSLFNANSSQQVIAYLQSLGFKDEILDRKKGTPSAAKGIIFKIRSDNKDKPFTEKLQRLAEFKSIATASSKLSSYMRSYDAARGALYTSYRPLATQGMGRSASGTRGSLRQNTQNFSKHLPPHQKHGLAPIKSFVMPPEGYVLAEFDLSGSHLKFAQQLSNDAAMWEATKTGVKLHYHTMSGLLAVDGHSLTPAECKYALTEDKTLSEKWLTYLETIYRFSKTVIFTALNKGGAATLQQSFFKVEVPISIEDCKKYLDGCYAKYYGLAAFQDRIFEQAQLNLRWVEEDGIKGWFSPQVALDGSLIWLYAPMRVDRRTGRLRPYLKPTDVCSLNWMRPEKTVMANWLGRCIELQRQRPNDLKLVNYCHDSGMFLIKKEHVEELAPIIQEWQDEEMRKYVPWYVSEESYKAAIKKNSWAK